jgi:AcrR family transcriptional regulator
MPSKPQARPTTSQPRPRGRPVGDRNAKTGELLLAAREVIAEEGCVAASIRKVAQQAGCSTGAITYYFADRDDLLARVVEDVFADFDRWLEPDDGLEGVRAILEYQLLPRRDSKDQQQARQVWLQLLVHANTDAKLATVIERLYGRFRERLTLLVAQAQKRGTIRSDLPASLLADHISAIGDGLLMVLPVERKRFDRQRVQKLIDALIAMLRPVEGKRATPRSG